MKANIRFVGARCKPVSIQNTEIKTLYTQGLAMEIPGIMYFYSENMRLWNIHGAEARTCTGTPNSELASIFP